VVVAILGLIGGGSSNNKPKPNRIAAPAQSGKKAKTTTTSTAAAAPVPTRAALQLIATGTVYVCMVGSNGQKILNGVTLSAGQRTHVFTGRRFLVTVGNGQVKMRVNGKIHNVPESNNPINYVVTPRGRHTLPAAQAPTCA
jgi:hypothetical protein